MTTNFFIKAESTEMMRITHLILLLFAVVPCVLATPSATDTGSKTLLTQVHHVHLQTRTDIHAAQCETSSCATSTSLSFPLYQAPLTSISHHHGHRFGARHYHHHLHPHRHRYRGPHAIQPQLFV